MSAITLFQTVSHTGDHLGVLARNCDAQVKRVAKNFHFDKESQVRLHKTDTRRTHLPIDEPIRVFDILSEYVELQEPDTRTQIKRMIEYTQDPTEKAKLIELSGDDETSQAMYRRKPRHGWWISRKVDEERLFFCLK